MKLVKRIGVAAVLIAVLAAALYFGGWVLCALFTAGAVMAAYEMGSALAKKELKPFMLPAYIFALLYFAAYRVFGGMGLWIVAMACILIAMADRIFTEARTAQDTMASMFVLVYPMSLFAAVAMLCEYGADADKSRIALLCAFAMPLMGDTLAYFGGRLLGKKKLCPRLSPNKTVAGSIFGFVGGGIGGALVFLMQNVWNAGAGLIMLIILGVICGGAGQIGDLFASSIKRYAGIKDYSRVFSEHGGVMDRLDSVLFCAPIVYTAFTVAGV